MNEHGQGQPAITGITEAGDSHAGSVPLADGVAEAGELREIGAVAHDGAIPQDGGVPQGIDEHPPIAMPHAGPGRIAWLDGVRALAALYVMLHHFWLSSYPDFPRDTGPWFLSWLLYGQLSVVVFIAVSGFSLTLAPRRNGMRLRGGARRFARTRAWRILPPYWASLVMSMLVVHLVTAPRNGFDVNLKSFVVHGLLLQDVLGSHTPNGTFWSIAVEAQIYVLFPLMLWLARRLSVPAMTAVTVAVVCLAYLLAIHVPAFARINNLTPQLLAGFALGVLAASGTARQLGQRRAGHLGRRWLLPLGLSLAVVVIVAIALLGSVRVIDHYFWVDVLVAAVTALIFRGLTEAPSSRLARMLAWRPLEFLGEFSYSIYLVHGPWLSVVVLYLLPSLHLSPTGNFFFLLCLVGPVLVAISYGFFRVFEFPFLTVRSWAQLRQYVARTPQPDS